MSHAPADPPRPVSRIEVSPKTLLYAVLAVGAVWLLIQLWTVVMVVIVALILVGTLDPMVSWLERRHIKRGWALAIVFLGLTGVLAGVLFLSVPPLINELQGMIEGAPAERTKLIALLNQHKWAAPFAKSLNEVPLDKIMVEAASYSFNLLGVLGYGITTLFLAIYLLADPRHAKGALYALVPRKHHVKTARIVLELGVIVGGYMRGQVITSVAITIFMFVLMTVLGVDNALAIAIFAGFTDIIPFIGGYVASAPAVLAVSDRGVVIMLVVAGLAILYQEFESRILVPRVYGRVLRLSPALVLIALLVGGTLLGILGALVALPIAAGLQMLVFQLRLEMPGQPDLADERERDERAEDAYVQLTAGTPAADAQIIAGEMAQKIKDTEKEGVSVTEALPAIIEGLQPDAVAIAAQGAVEKAEDLAIYGGTQTDPPTPDEPKRPKLAS